MKNLQFLKPVFSLGFLLFLAFMTVANLLIFKYIPTGVGAFWFIIVEELALILAYVFSRSLTKPDEVIWWFAKKWWDE